MLASPLEGQRELVIPNPFKSPAALVPHLQTPKMAETTGSSPLSEISEPVAPPEASVKPAIEVSSVSPHLPSSSAPSASTPTAPVPAVSNSSTTAPSPKKAASRSRRKPSAKSLAAGGTGIAIVEEPCPACEKLDARSRKANSKIGTVWVECDQLVYSRLHSLNRKTDLV